MLSHLQKHGPQTLTELSEHDRVSPASMSQTLNRLSSAGFAVRSRDPGDGRKVLFGATAEGDELASAAWAQRNAWLDEQLRALSPEDRAVVARRGAPQQHRRLLTSPAGAGWSSYDKGGA